MRLLLNYFLFLYSAGRDGEGQPEINPFAKNALSIAQNCSETQISFACAQPSRQKRGVDNTENKKSLFSGTLSLFWGFELYHFNDLTFDPKRPKGAFNSYTAFRKRVEEGSQVRASNLEKLSWRMMNDVFVYLEPFCPLF